MGLQSLELLSFPSFLSLESFRGIDRKSAAGAVNFSYCALDL